MKKQFLVGLFLLSLTSVSFASNRCFFYDGKKFSIPGHGLSLIVNNERTNCRDAKEKAKEKAEDFIHANCHSEVKIEYSDCDWSPKHGIVTATFKCQTDFECTKSERSYFNLNRYLVDKDIWIEK